MTSPFSIAILGIDGSGKSTVSARVARALSATERVCRISDVLEFFEHGEPRPARPRAAEKARLALGKLARATRSLNRYKIPRLAELILRDRLSGRVRGDAEVLVLDGSPLLNIMTWARIYRGAAFDDCLCTSAMRMVTGRGRTENQEEAARSMLPELATLERLGLARLGMPDAVVLLDVAPEVCMRRIESRGEARQVHETHRSLSLLREGYLMVSRVIQAEFDVPVTILREPGSIEEATEGVLSFIGACRRSGRRAPDDDPGH